MKDWTPEAAANNPDVPGQTFDCIQNGGTLEYSTETRAGLYKDWKVGDFGCKQQYLGRMTYHSLALRFQLEKDLRRRRRILAEPKENEAGAKGSFGFQLETGQCVRPKDGDANGDCGTTASTSTSTGGGEESFATLAAILSIFAL